MKFELSVALKYLLPRTRQLSVSIISLVSVLVISLVVWLVVVFLTVTHGIEKKWVDELVAMNAPLRITPNEAYYRSYYYQIDNQAQASNYSTKSIGEKLTSETSDPYDPTFDAELPSHFPQPLKNSDGSVKDLIKEAWGSVLSLKQSHLRPEEFEVAFGNLQLDLLRKDPITEETSKNLLSQVSYIASQTKENSRFAELILSPREQDVLNLHALLPPDTSASLLAYKKPEIPSHTVLGEGIVVSKSFLKNDVRIGDKGTLSYFASAGGSLKEQKIPVYVAGFYDPGMMPVGNKVIYAGPSLLAMLRSQSTFTDNMLGNGVNIWFQNIASVDKIKADLQATLQERGIAPYFEIESYKDFEFAKPVLEQLQSDKTLFTLIALIILIVACSNIISMLILLVNDKRKEIGILQSMGVSSGRIATIFGLCGSVLGLISSLIGTLAAIYTLHHLQSLVNFLSFLQGHEAFQSAFYGERGLPNELSFNAIAFVLVATTIISLIAGIVPAMKASKIRPAETLRAE